MQPPSLRKLFEIRIFVETPFQEVGDTPHGERRVALVTGGTFTGEGLNGVILNGGTDWLLGRPDGALELNVNLVLKTDEGDLIAMRYQGLRHGPAQIMAKVAKGEDVPQGSYYFKVTGRFETASKRHEALNKLVFVGEGRRASTGPVYDIYALE